jgi:hypothetical protein
MRYRPRQLRRVATQLHIPAPIVRRVQLLVESSGLLKARDDGELEWRWAGDGLRIATEPPRLRLRSSDPRQDVAFEL